MSLNGLKSQDIFLALHLLADSEFRRQSEYAKELGLSQPEVSNALKRLSNARFIDPQLQLPYRRNLKEFLIHGLKYVFPVEPASLKKGVPTAHSAKPMLDKLRAGGLPYVWPSKNGEVKGQAIEPLYASVPEAVQTNPQLYELLAIVDSIRLGKPRELRVAISELEQRLG